MNVICHGATVHASIDFSADTYLQCRMAEKDLLAWAEHNKEIPVGYSQYSHLDVVYSDATLTGTG
jgi:hypothetical protein